MTSAVFDADPPTIEVSAAQADLCSGRIWFQVQVQRNTCDDDVVEDPLFVLRERTHFDRLHNALQPHLRLSPITANGLCEVYATACIPPLRRARAVQLQAFLCEAIAAARSARPPPDDAPGSVWAAALGSFLDPEGEQQSAGAQCWRLETEGGESGGGGEGHTSPRLGGRWIPLEVVSRSPSRSSRAAATVPTAAPGARGGELEPVQLELQGGVRKQNNLLQAFMM